MAKQKLSRKILNICIICTIIIAIIFTAILLILNYDEKGETNMPFLLSKISIVSTVDKQDVENSEYKWAMNVIQNNDIYIYIEKNKEYKKQETIASIKINNVNLVKKPNIGEIKTYKPASTENSIFQNIDENLIKEIEFIGNKNTNVRNLEISNQGGMIAFRCANNNIGTYTSNEDEQINYNELLKKLNIKEEDLKFDLLFDITITLNSGKVFKAEEIKLELPNKNIVEDGTSGRENTDLKDVVFKRIEN